MQAPLLTERQLNAVNEYVSNILGFPVRFTEQNNSRDKYLLLQTPYIKVNATNGGVFSNIMNQYRVYVNLFYELREQPKENVQPGEQPSKFDKYQGTITIEYIHTGNSGQNGCATNYGIAIERDTKDKWYFTIRGYIGLQTYSPHIPRHRAVTSSAYPFF
jgi:hypothetical protein